MADRLTRTGRHVVDRARRFSDDLLVEEERVYAGFRRLFDASARDVAKTLTRLDDRTLHAGGWRPALTAEADAVHARIAPAIERLLGRTFDLAHEAIADELRALANTGRLDHDRLRVALADVRDSKAVAVDAPDLSDASVRRLLDGTAAQIDLARRRGETRDLLVRRVCALRPALPGATTGVWPSGPGWLSVRVRAQVIDLANAVRLAVMENADG